MFMCDCDHSHLTHQLCVDLGHTVDGTGSLHTQIRGGVPG